MTCPECSAGRPPGLVYDWLELAHDRRSCSLGRAEDATRHEDLAAAWDLRLPAFDRAVTATELTPGNAVAWAAAQDDDDAGDPDERPATREARYRREARDAQALAAQLTERVERLQRAEVERLAGARVAAAGDVFAIGGAQLADLLDDTGHVDAARVDAAVGELLTSRPCLAKGARVAPPSFGQGALGASAPPSTSWTSVLRGEGRAEVRPLTAVGGRR